MQRTACCRCSALPTCTGLGSAGPATGQSPAALLRRWQSSLPAPCWLPTAAVLASCPPKQTVSSLGVVRVLAVHRSDYESIAERFQDSARAVLENLLRYTQQAGAAGCWVPARACMGMCGGAVPAWAVHGSLAIAFRIVCRDS